MEDYTKGKWDNVDVPAFIGSTNPERSDTNFYVGVLIGLVLATVFWVAFATVLWLILR